MIKEAKSPWRPGKNIRRLRSLGRRRSSSSIVPVGTRVQDEVSSPSRHDHNASWKGNVLLIEDGEATADESSSEGELDVEQESGDESRALEEVKLQDSIQMWLHDFFHNAIHIVPFLPFVCHAAEQLRDCVGATILHLVAPADRLGSGDSYDKSRNPNRYLSCAGESSAEASFLDRLRLDYPGMETDLETCIEAGGLPGGEELASPNIIQGAIGVIVKEADGLIHNASQIVLFVCHTVDRIKDDVGATLLGIVAPMANSQGNNNDAPVQASPKRYVSCAGESSAEASFLDRLKLDYPASETDTEMCVEKGWISGTEVVKVRSKFLLRVCDLAISTEESKSSEKQKVYFIDLCGDHAEIDLTTQALDALVEGGLSLFSANEECRVGTGNGDCPVRWKPEGNTEKLLRKKNKMTSQQWMTRLEREVLIWSGQFDEAGKCYTYGNQFPLFLAKGVVCMTPREILRLMWDNGRTGDYNKWSMGRKDLTVIEDGNVLAPDHVQVDQGSKIVESETKVPFTNLVVSLSALMHVRPLEGDEGSYVVVSRSLNIGRAGCHFYPDGVDDRRRNNEILWGVNVLKSVPDEPNKTNFMSVSHVGTSLVPGFLSKKIGTMGVDDFFKAVRKLADKK